MYYLQKLEDNFSAIFYSTNGMKMNFGVYRLGNYKGHIQTPLSRLHLDGESNPGPPGRRSRALPQSYIPTPLDKWEHLTFGMQSDINR